MKKSTQTQKTWEADDDLLDFDELAKDLTAGHGFSIRPTAKDDPEDDHENTGWLDSQSEGQLAIDVYENEHSFVIKSTIAGVKPEDLDIAIENDLVTIRGKRQHEEQIEEDDYIFRECYWGDFSRAIILPSPIKSEGVEASLKNGVLTVILPKAKANSKIKVKAED